MDEVGAGIYHLPEIVGGPAILLDGAAVLVDTGVPGSEDAILGALAELGAPLTDIVITHADGDHVGSLEALVARTGARVWAPEAEADVVEGRSPGRGGDIRQSGRVDRRFSPGETLPLHGGIETLATHGHTRGHVSLFLPGERLLIAGDALNNRDGLTGSAPEHTADAAQARDSVHVLAALEPETIVFGHGSAIVGGASERLHELDRSLG